MKTENATGITWPEIPKYLKDPMVFIDSQLGICMVSVWGEHQWLFRAHNGQWCSVRQTNSNDPIFIDPINKPTTTLPPAATDCGDSKDVVAARKEKD